MSIPFEFILLAALLGTGLSVYLAFLPLTSIPRRVFVRGAAIMAISWMFVAYVFGFKQLMILLIAAVSSIGWWKFVNNDTTKGKLLLAFASGAGIGIGVVTVLETYLGLRQINLTSSQFVWYASRAYACSLLLGTSVSAVLCTLENDPDQAIRPTIVRAMIIHLAVSCLGIVFFTSSLVPLLYWICNACEAAVAWRLLKSNHTKAFPILLYALPVLAVVATLSSLRHFGHF